MFLTSLVCCCNLWRLNQKVSWKFINVSSMSFYSKLEPERTIYSRSVSHSSVIIKSFNEGVLGKFGWNINSLFTNIWKILTSVWVIQVTCFFISSTLFSKSKPLTIDIIVAGLLTRSKDHFEIWTKFILNILETTQISLRCYISTTEVSLHFVENCRIVLVNVVFYKRAVRIWECKMRCLRNQKCFISSRWQNVLHVSIIITYMTWNSNYLVFVWTSFYLNLCVEKSLFVTVHCCNNLEVQNLWLYNISFDKNFKTSRLFQIVCWITTSYPKAIDHTILIRYFHLSCRISPW